MENKNNPLSPHIQIYRWHISSLLSITHRIVGILNFFAIISMSTLLIFNNLDLLIFEKFSQSFVGKFFIISFCWTFSFQILNEIRHLAWDIGFGFDLKVSKISGIITIIGSFVLTVLFYLLGRSLI
tara:strand:- start:438 stop:815 length:378 start_codon:yes stop_codon:yes gene_type:complete